MPEPTPAEASDLRFFEGFAWAVPLAFAGALASLRFEPGDVLHRARDAYSDEPGAADGPAEALQVLASPGSARSVDGDADPRRASFESAVRLARVDLRSGARRELDTTQGRLLMTLWRGDLSWIEGEGEAPPVPLGARSLAGELEGLREAFEAALAERAGRPDAGMLFLFVVDLASDASRVKAESIREALGFSHGAVWLDRTPAALGLASAASYHPALIVRGVALPGVDEERVTEALRGALYGGRAGAAESTAAAGDGADETEAASRPADRFSVARHGLLVPLSG